MPPSSQTVASADAPPAAPASGVVVRLAPVAQAIVAADPCDRVSRLLALVRSLVLLAADGSNSPMRRAEAHRLAAQSVRQARAVLDTWTEQHAYADGGDTCSWAGTVIVDLNDAVCAAEASVGALGALPLPQPAYTRASGIRPVSPARRAGGAR